MVARRNDQEEGFVKDELRRGTRFVTTERQSPKSWQTRKRVSCTSQRNHGLNGLPKDDNAQSLISQKQSQRLAMGLILSSLFHRLIGSGEEYRLLMLGLDNAGKTTILYKLKLGDLVHSIPTVGFNVETVEFHNLNFTVWDVGGQHKIRRLWKHYFPGTQGIIFVVDACDCDRLDEAAHELHMLLSNEELDGAAVLVLANKQDMPGAVSAKAVGERLGLQRLRNRQWYIQACSALQNKGLYEGLEWLGATLRKQKN